MSFRSNILLCLLIFIAVVHAQAQDFTGFTTGNFTGISGVHLQPASIVDSRFRFDAQIGGSSFFGNNYMGIRKEAFSTPGAFDDGQFLAKYITARDNGKDKSFLYYTDLHLAEFMVSMSPKHSLGFSSRYRIRMNADGIDQSMATLIKNELIYPSLWNNQLRGRNVSLQAMNWADFGITYGRVLMDDNQHFLKGAITPKFLMGLGAGYLFIHQLDYSFTNDDTLNIFATDAQYGHSNNFELQADGSPASIIEPGVGVDIGFVYEWRPDHKDYRYDMDGKTGIYRRDKNKYKLRAGISLVDLGAINYTKASTSRNFHADIRKWNIDDEEFKNIDAFDSIINSRFSFTPDEGDFSMNLPTALSVQLDYHLHKGFYVNFMPYWAIKFKNNPHKVHGLSSYVLTPRWESKWIGLYLPVSYNEYRNTSVGFDIRFGPLVIGTTDLLTFVANKDVFSAEGHLMLKLPIPYGFVNDRDKDKVSDKVDECIDVPGVWEFKGCPDSDGDLVADAVDNCPTEPGRKESGGCPDRDNDSVIDKMDECPDAPGPPELNGCPDSDGDGILDKEDKCPLVKGPKDANGCPDTDADGIVDSEDLCPDKKGPFHNLGCPETKLYAMLNGIVVAVAVRNEKGEFIFENLPSNQAIMFRIEGEDTEFIYEVKVKQGNDIKTAKKMKDGLFSLQKLNFEETALSKLEEVDVPVKLMNEEEAVVKKAFNNLQYGAGTEAISPQSFNSLDELAQLLQKKKNWKIKVTGHTDNTGNFNINQFLSKRRAEAVREYLVSKGIEKDRILVEFYGDTRPIADNNTPEGKQKNRRVELQIVE